VDGQTIVAIIAAVIALVAAGVAWWQALSAKRQADAAEDSSQAAKRQADAAEQDLKLAQDQWAQQQRDRDEQALGHARQVHATIEGFKYVKISNFSTGPITQVVLLDVAVRDEPELTWSYPPSSGNTEELVPPNEDTSFRVIFTRPNGTQSIAPSRVVSDYLITFAFTDATSRRWERSGRNDPHLVTER
jgi:hypothetical protein